MDPSATFGNCQSTAIANKNSSHNDPNSQTHSLRHECDVDLPQTGVQQLSSEIHERNNHGWRRIVLNFTPSWFSVTMGTGITSILLHNLPYNGAWLRYISIAIFCLNILLFILFTAVSALRYYMFKGLWGFMIRHPVQSLFVGTFPMGLATIINMVVFVCVPADWGTWTIYLAWGLWWFDVVVAVATCCYLPFVVMAVQEHELAKMTATWLLPIVSTIVASASGGIIANVLVSVNPQHAVWTVIVGYVLWGTGFPLAMVVLVIYFQRLAVYKLPPREVIVSVFLPLGPLGQGSYALMQLGKVSMKLFPITGTLGGEVTGRVFYGFGHGVGLVIWGYGLVWLFFAVASISRTTFAFNMGWWGFTFPLGVYAVSTVTLGQDIPSLFFRILGTIFSLTVVILWLGVGLETARRAWTGDIFFAPCVRKYEEERAAIKAGVQEPKDFKDKV